MGRSLSLPSPSENGDGQDEGDEILEGNETQVTNLQKDFLGDDPVPIRLPSMYGIFTYMNGLVFYGKCR